MRSVAHGAFVLLVSAATIAPASAAPPCAPGAVCAALKAEARAPKFTTTPVVSYTGGVTETIPADDTIAGFSGVGEYAAFEPARVVRSPAPRLSLLARMRRAASRILSATANLPHF